MKVESTAELQKKSQMIVNKLGNTGAQKSAPQESAGQMRSSRLDPPPEAVLRPEHNCATEECDLPFCFLCLNVQSRSTANNWASEAEPLRPGAQYFTNRESQIASGMPFACSVLLNSNLVS
eukprot:CAMPEP_0205900066 /NCGR_PEP_ID=MMETSP1083-20121108/26953_1 /ASSEMBLY_ACC=CAM_ASM_000430 /TAXON_ID=97485 /ORGANISM="Prymnesium parvum, Strain Texoma1" /LENGTH=120 /DNA_ID=CAMNT_0053265509 /DNA_START=32 /DNA_END=393 /DNA_ORIENTATION=+